MNSIQMASCEPGVANTRSSSGTRQRSGLDTVRPISYELCGRPGVQTVHVHFVTSLAEARQGEVDAESVKFKNDGEIGGRYKLSSTTHEESLFTNRRALRGAECERDAEGQWGW